MENEGQDQIVTVIDTVQNLESVINLLNSLVKNTNSCHIYGELRVNIALTCGK